MHLHRDREDPPQVMSHMGFKRAGRACGGTPTIVFAARIALTGVILPITPTSTIATRLIATTSSTDAVHI